MRKRPAPPPRMEVVETRYFRTSDEDDDRCFMRGRERVFANPQYLAHQAAGRFGGWHPPYALRTRDMQPVYVTDDAPDGYAGTAGFFRATLMGLPGGPWRVSCWGCDDFGLERDRLTERKARSLWGLLRDHTTVRTLYRLGFVPT